MPQRIVPGSVKVLTQDGEVQVTITLELNINLNTDGVQVAAQATTEKKKDNTVSLPEGGDWLVPDFGASPKLDFGKRE